MLTQILIAELRYRPWTALLTVLITACSVALVLFFFGISEMLAARTRLIQRDLGLNLRFIPAGTNLDRYWLRGYADGSIDESLVDRLVSQEVANRLVPMLQRTIPFGDSEAILTGIGEERFAAGAKQKSVFGSLVDDQQRVVLGSVAAGLLGLSEGDAVDILGHRFQVARVLAPEGSLDDLRIHADLSVVQTLLSMPGKVNEIRALECNCEESILDPEAHLRATLEPLLPGTMMIRHDKLADARRRQRQLADRMASVASPLVVVLSAVLVCALLLLNTYQRRGEIGLFSAVGKSHLFVAAVIGGRAILLGVFSGCLGTIAAWVLLALSGETFFGSSGPALSEILSQAAAPQSVGLGLLLGAAIPTVASLMPIVWITRIDPALTLRMS